MLHRLLVLFFCAALTLALIPACNEGLIRPLFETPRDVTELVIQNFQIPEIPEGAGVYQFWVGAGEERISVAQFVFVASKLWPPEYLDVEDPDDLPPGLESFGTTTTAKFEIDLPEGITRASIDTVFLTIEPHGEDDLEMSDSLLLVGKVNRRGRANLSFDTDGEYAGLPNVFAGSGKIMLALPTSRPPSGNGNGGEASSLTRTFSQDGDDTPPVWANAEQMGIISGSYDTENRMITITFGLAEDADSPPVSYVAYWQEGDTIDFEDALSGGRVFSLPTGEETEPPFSVELTQSPNQIPESAMGKVISIAVHARDSASPFNETPPLDPHPSHPGGHDWLIIEPDTPYYKGVWFVTIPEGETEPVSSLNLPDLTDVPGWTYQAWAFKADDDTLLNIGRFDDPSGADDDGGGESAGEGEPYNAPGSDFLNIEGDYDFREVGWEIYITVEPEPDASGAGFVWKILSYPADGQYSKDLEVDMNPHAGQQPFLSVRIL